MVTIIIDHPWHGSFNFAILKSITDALDKQGRGYNVIDLCADGFDPRMGTGSLAMYSRGESDDPLVKKYISVLRNTSEVVFIFPIWWSMMPAELKGFFDRVFLKGKVVDYGADGRMIPLLDIDKTLMVTTSEAPSAMFAPFFSDYLKSNVFSSVGMHNVQWVNCEGTSHGPAANREAFLRKVAAMV